MNRVPDWFEIWFDSPYYDLLYPQRDELEAAAFLQRILVFLSLPDRARILDLACGKGRHCRFLASRGFRVTGIDLSPLCIAAAEKFQTGGANFVRDDMRSFNLPLQFDAILNLFTSFGYFDPPKENEEVVRRVSSHLTGGGYFVLDYFNPTPVVGNLVKEEVGQVGSTRLLVRRYVRNNKLIKEISVDDQGINQQFREEVQLFSPGQLAEMFIRSGLDVVHTFGDYELNPFVPETSPRTILIARKN